MPDKPTPTPCYCPYCGVFLAASEVLPHVYSADHISKVRNLKRSAAYRNRQGDLPFPPTLPNTPKVR
jgi:hypothetical protein